MTDDRSNILCDYVTGVYWPSVAGIVVLYGTI